MKETLEFRVWSKNEKKFLTENLFLTKDGFLVDENFCEIKNCVVQRSTGRVDKHGILIFEGDVLWDDYEKDFCRVYYDEGGFRVGTIPHWQLNELSSYDEEIRGNIFEGWTSPYQDVPVREGWTRYENKTGVSDEEF